MSQKGGGRYLDVTIKEAANVRLAYVPTPFIHKLLLIIINGGILSLTDSHHHHHGQNPTMVGICHGGNVPPSHDDDDKDDFEFRTPTTNFSPNINFVSYCCSQMLLSVFGINLLWINSQKKIIFELIFENIIFELILEKLFACCCSSSSSSS